MLTKKCATPAKESSSSQLARAVERCEDDGAEVIGERSSKLTCQEIAREQARDKVESLEQQREFNMQQSNSSRIGERTKGLEHSEFPIRKDVAALRSSYDSNAMKQQPISGTTNQQTQQQHTTCDAATTNHHNQHNHHHHSHHQQQQNPQQQHHHHRRLNHNHHTHSCLAASSKLVNNETNATQVKHHQPHCIHHINNNNQQVTGGADISPNIIEAGICRATKHQNIITGSKQQLTAGDKSYVLVEYRSPQVNERLQTRHARGIERSSGATATAAHDGVGGGIMHNNKRTTMRFISQLYFLIHLSAVLSLLLHHKNLVASERKLLLYDQQQRHASGAGCNLGLANNQSIESASTNHLNKRTTMGNGSSSSHSVELSGDQQVIGLHKLNEFSSNPLPVPQTHRADKRHRLDAGYLKNDLDLANQDQQRAKQQQLLHNNHGDNTGDVLVRLLGFWHAKYALHYFLGYLLTTSVAILISWRLFSTYNKRNGTNLDAMRPTVQSNTKYHLESNNYGFYYRARLDCSPVLIGCISLGLIQLVVIGLDVANNFDWIGSGEAQRWFTYLLLIQFAFVALLMHHILNRVTKRHEMRRKQQESLAPPSAASLLDRQTRLATRQELDLDNLDSSDRQLTAALAINAHRNIGDHDDHHHCNKSRLPISLGLQNIALAHLLVTHILLWLMKSNSINLFQVPTEQLATAVPIPLPPSPQPPPSSPSNAVVLSATATSGNRFFHSSPSSNESSSSSHSMIGPLETSPTSSTKTQKPISTTSTLSSLNETTSPRSSSGSQEQKGQESMILTSDKQANSKRQSKAVPNAASKDLAAKMLNNNKTSVIAIDGDDTDGDNSDRPPSSPSLRFGESANGSSSSSSIIKDTSGETLTEATPAKTTTMTLPPAVVVANQPPRSRPIRVVTPTAGSTDSGNQLSAKSDESRAPIATRGKQSPGGAITTSSPASSIERVIPKPKDSQGARLVAPADKSFKSQTAGSGNQRAPAQSTAAVIKSSIPKRTTFFRQRRPGEKGITAAPAKKKRTQTTKESSVDRDRDEPEVDLRQRSQRAHVIVTHDSQPKSHLSSAEPANTEKRHRERVFPSVEGDPDPPSTRHIYGSFTNSRPSSLQQTTAAPVAAIIGAQLEQDREIASSEHADERELDASAGDDEDLDVLLPPVPNYIDDEIDPATISTTFTDHRPLYNANNHDADNIKNSQDVRLPEEAFAFIEAATEQLPVNTTAIMVPAELDGTNDTTGSPLPINLPLVMPQPPMSQQSQQQQHQTDRDGPSFAEYLLPIVHQYHILVIAILCYLWLESLCKSVASPPGGGQVAATGGSSSHSLSSSASSSPNSSRTSLSRSSSFKGLIAVPIKTSKYIAAQVTAKSPIRSRTRQNHASDSFQHRHRSRSMDSHHYHNHHHHDENRSNASSLSRRNSLRSSSSEQLLWIPSSRLKSSANPGALAPQRRNQHSPTASIVTPTGGGSKAIPGFYLSNGRHQDFSSNLSVCSVFFGLLVVSTSLIVILVGINLLTIITQCFTQLLSILACLLGQCLNWRLQCRLRRRAKRGDLQRIAYLAAGAARKANQHQHQRRQQQQHARPAGSNHRQCFHYLFLLAAYYCGISIAINLSRQHSAQQLFSPQVLQFIHRHLAHTLFRWTARPRSTDHLLANYLTLFHLILALKGLLLIVQVTLQTILIRSSSCQRATRELRQIYTFLMFANLGLWAMELCEQQQQQPPAQETDQIYSSPTTECDSTTKLRLMTLDGFNRFAASVVTLSHLYHGLVFMQH